MTAKATVLDQNAIDAVGEAGRSARWPRSGPRSVGCSSTVARYRFSLVASDICTGTRADNNCYLTQVHEITENERPAALRVEGSFAWRFHELRLNLGLTQVQLAVLMVIAVSTVNNWECGRTNPHPAHR